MRKLVAAGTVAALLALTASPALAQGIDVGNAVAVDNSTATGGDTTVEYVDASQFAFGFQTQSGDAVADDEATATVESEQGITINQANAGLGELSDVNQAGYDAGDVFYFLY